MRAHPVMAAPRELATLRVLERERTARAIELIDASRGRLPRPQAWMVLARLRRRGAIRIVRRVDNERGGLPVPVYGLTPYGRRVLKALAVLEKPRGP